MTNILTGALVVVLLAVAASFKGKVVVRAVCTCGFTSQSNSDNTMGLEFGFAHLDAVKAQQPTV